MKKLSLPVLAFLQALGLTLYCAMVGLFFFNINHVFPNKPDSFLAPMLLLILFVFSAIVCSLIFGYNAFIIFWEQKNTQKAFKLILYTTGWFLFFAFLVVLIIVIKK